MTSSPWFTLEDGWPHRDQVDDDGNYKGAIPYYAESLETEPQNPYSPYAVSFRTLSSMCELRNALPDIIRALQHPT